MIKDDLNSFLKASSGITTITSTRIYPKFRPQNTDLPAVVHTVSSEQEVVDMSGSFMYATTQFTVDCWAIGYRSAAVLADAVKTSMRVPTPYWWGAALVGESDRYDEETNEDNVTLSYAITHV